MDSGSDYRTESMVRRIVSEKLQLLRIDLKTEIEQNLREQLRSEHRSLNQHSLGMVDSMKNETDRLNEKLNAVSDALNSTRLDISDWTSNAKTAMLKMNGQISRVRSNQEEMQERLKEHDRQLFESKTLQTNEVNHHPHSSSSNFSNNPTHYRTSSTGMNNITRTEVDQLQKRMDTISQQLSDLQKSRMSRNQGHSNSMGRVNNDPSLNGQSGGQEERLDDLQDQIIQNELRLTELEGRMKQLINNGGNHNNNHVSHEDIHEMNDLNRDYNDQTRNMMNEQIQQQQDREREMLNEIEELKWQMDESSRKTTENHRILRDIIDEQKQIRHGNQIMKSDLDSIIDTL